MKDKLKKRKFIVFLSILFLSLISCGSDGSDTTEEETPATKTLTANVNKIDFIAKGEAASVAVTTTAASWTIASNVDWIQLSKTSGSKGSSLVSVTALENKTTVARTGIVTLSSSEAASVQISVSQAAGTDIVQGLYPDYNTNPIAADASGMSSTAVQLAAKMKLGWNIGNSLEASGSEEGWGNPKVTKELINLVKANGFNAIRIPCTWNQYANNSTAKISAAWLTRVKEVVQYCVDNEMYVVLNIHWDGGWLEEHCTEDKKEANNAKQKAFWQQIATHFRDYDEHLLFASANEPNVDDTNQMAVLNSYHQTFIDAVRSTGGKNAYRNLIVQGPRTDITKTNNWMNTLPTDKVADRMMVEIHCYTPWAFAGLTKDESWSKMFYYWGADNHSATDTDHNPDWGEEAQVNADFKLMKTKFIDKGIPVIMGEYGAIRRSDLTGDNLALHLKSRNYYLNYVTKQAKANGLIPFYWDEGSITNNGFGIFNRKTNTVFDVQALNALMDGIK